MTSRLLTVGLLAGLGAGILVAGLQTVVTTPLILHAEMFEGAEEAAPAPHSHDAQPTDAAAPAAMASEHHHDAEDWAPADGLERTGYTALATVATAIGFALMLVSVMVFSGTRPSVRTGLAWAAAAFAATGLAPALGLSPELPGMPAADLTARQLWWVGTAAATAIGLWLLIRRPEAGLKVVGVALLVLPHVIGAPHLAGEEASAVPPELAARFAAASLTLHAILWALIGAFSGWLWQRLERRAPGLAPA